MCSAKLCKVSKNTVLPENILIKRIVIYNNACAKRGSSLFWRLLNTYYIELVKELEKRIEEIENAELAALKENKEVVEKDIDYYLKKGAPYSQLFDCLDDGPMFKSLFDPLCFFELLDSEVAFFTEHAENYAEIKKRLKGLDLEGQQRYFFLHPLKDIIELKYADGQIKKTTMTQMAFDYLLKMYQKADLEVFPFRERLSPMEPKKQEWLYPSTYFGHGNTHVEYQKAINPYLIPYYPTPAYLNEKFTMKDVMRQFEKKPDYVGKIRYLIEISTEYQHLGIEGSDIDEDFIKQCELEITKIKAFKDLQSEVAVKSTFKLSEKKGAKTNLIRIFNALHSLRFIVSQQGDFPNKSEFMKRFGDFLNIDLSNYDSDLTQAFSNGNLEPNLNVFQDMIEFTKNEVEKRLEAPKSKH